MFLSLSLHKVMTTEIRNIIQVIFPSVEGESSAFTLRITILIYGLLAV